MMTGAFKATYIFGYIVACMFVVFFLVLVAAPSEFVGECQQQKQGCMGAGCDPKPNQLQRHYACSLNMA